MSETHERDVRRASQEVVLSPISTDVEQLQSQEELSAK